MSRVLIGIVVLVAALVAWDRKLSRDAASSRAGQPAVERLLPPERTAHALVAAISIEDPKHQARWLYARTKGVWRCREAFGAIAHSQAIQSLMANFLEARGVVRTSDPARARSYGLDPEQALIVSFHGPRVLDDPTHDVLFAFDLARAPEGGASIGRAFVREHGGARVIEIDRDPLALLEMQPGEQAPMLDLRLLAGSLSAGFLGFQSITLDFSNAASLKLSSVAPAQSDAPAEWFLEQNGQRTPCLEWRVGGLTSLLLLARFSAIESPARAAEFGLDRPLARITLVPNDGAPIELLVGAVDFHGEAPLSNKTSRVLGRIAGDVQSLLMPDAAMFLDAARPNPWEAWLRR